MARDKSQAIICRRRPNPKTFLCRNETKCLLQPCGGRRRTENASSACLSVYIWRNSVKHFMKLDFRFHSILMTPGLA